MFKFEGKEFEYVHHEHNRTRINERAVELPLVEYFLNEYPDCVEIGAVSPYYFEGRHLIYDLTDNHPRSAKKDAIEVSVYDQALLSVSTIEHIGHDFGDIKDEMKAIRLLDKWLAQSGPYLITWPLGFNLFLDQMLFENHKILNPKFVARRPYPSHDWKQVSLEQLTETDKIYGSFSCANSIVVLSSIF